MRSPGAKNILTVGTTGRVGRMLTKFWATNEPGSVAFTHQHRDQSRKDGLYWTVLNQGATPLKDYNERNSQFDAMIVLAGATPGQTQDLSLNISLAQAYVSAAKVAGIPRVLIASSSAVYGCGNGSHISEEYQPLPLNDYGRAKLEMEQNCHKQLDGSLEICCLRIGNVAGADALLLNLADKTTTRELCIDRFENNKSIERSYIGAKTLSKVLLKLALTPNPLPFLLNVAAPQPVSMEALAIATGHPYKFSQAPENAVQKIVLDCGLLSGLYDFQDRDSQPETMIKQWQEAIAE